MRTINVSEGEVIALVLPDGDVVKVTQHSPHRALARYIHKGTEHAFPLYPAPVHDEREDMGG